MPLKKYSREVVFINTNTPEDRLYLLKPNIDLLLDDAEVAESNILTIYAHRHRQLDSTFPAEYAAPRDRTVSSAIAESNTYDEEVAEDDSSPVRKRSTRNHSSTPK